MKHGIDCDADAAEACWCGLLPGQLQERHGVLCTVDERGHFYVRAPRRSDVQLAQRVVAAVASSKDDRSKILVSDLRTLRETK